MIIDDDGIVFSTGKKIWCHLGIVGIAPDLTIYEGYDGDIDERKLDSEERIELADHAIKLWQQFKERSV